MEKLTNTLSALAHLNLEGYIVEKHPLQAGLGGTCDVFTAWSTKHKRKVAIKRIRVFMRKDRALAKKLEKETVIWAKLDHECVLPLLGFIFEGEDIIPSFVSEWMEHGTLNDFMTKFPRGGSDTWNMLSWIASGLEYLHEQGVIHADLKSHNILISDKLIPLLADFGLSTVLSQTMMGTATFTTNGTVRWMAVELLLPGSNGEFSLHSRESDVWAFGMVAFELLSGNVPYHKYKSDIQVILEITKGSLPTKPENEHGLERFDLLWNMCQTCWDKDPAERPTAAELCEFLSTDLSVALTTTPQQQIPVVEPTVPLNSARMHDTPRLMKDKNLYTKIQNGNILDCVRSESPVGMFADLYDSDSEAGPVVPREYKSFVRNLHLARKLSTPAGLPNLAPKMKSVISTTRATYPQRKVSRREHREGVEASNMQTSKSMRQEAGLQSPTSKKANIFPSAGRPAPMPPSKVADGKLLHQISDIDGVPVSPGKGKRWILHGATLTAKSLKLQYSDHGSSQSRRITTISLRDKNTGGMAYTLTFLQQTSMPSDGGSRLLTIYPFALVPMVGLGSSREMLRFAAVSEGERNMWIGAFTEIAGVLTN